MEENDYNSIHRAFLQALFSRSTITYTDSKILLSAILTAHHDRPILPGDITFSQFTNILHTLNSALSPFAYEIKSMHPQNANTRQQEEAVYALVNVTSDLVTAMATLYTPDEIAYVRRVLDGIFDMNNIEGGKEICGIKVMDALRLAKVPGGGSRRVDATQPANGDDTHVTQTQGQVASLTQDRAEKMIEQLVEEGWLDRSSAGFVTFSTKGLMELGRWLVETYNDSDEQNSEEGVWQRIKICEGCKQIVTIGQRCPNVDCLCRLHDFCVETYFRGQDVRKCPLCRSEWTGRDFVGERAARGMGSAGVRPSQGRRSGGR